MFADSYELQSFLCKFLQLSHDGLTSTLSFKCVGGNVEINLNASLELPSSPAPPFQSAKPSRIRRRKRRRKKSERHLIVNDNDLNTNTSLVDGEVMAQLQNTTLLSQVHDVVTNAEPDEGSEDVPPDEFSVSAVSDSNSTSSARSLPQNSLPNDDFPEQFTFLGKPLDELSSSEYSDLMKQVKAIFEESPS